MGKLPLQRVKNCLHHYTEDELWELREATDQQLARLEPHGGFDDPIQNKIVGMASVISIRYFEEAYQPFTDARYKLRALIEIMDGLTASLWDEALSKFLNNAFEQELSGTWYNLLSIAAGREIDLKESQPEIANAIENRLKALHEFTQKGNGEPLREVVKSRLNIDRLIIPQMGRPPKLTDATKSLGEFAHNRMLNGDNRKEAAKQYIIHIQTKTEKDRSIGEKKALQELLRRPENKTTGEQISTRGDYTYEQVKRYREANGLVESRG